MNEKYFVYFECGSCNDGSHSNELKEFDTLEEAYQYIERYIKKQYDWFWNGHAVIWKGVQVERLQGYTAKALTYPN